MDASRVIATKKESTLQPTSHIGEVVYFSPQDERANVLTHSLGFALSIIAAAYLGFRTRSLEPGFHYCCLSFGFALICVYCLSTLSHAAQRASLRHRLRAWDQGTIYLLIVATYSPFIWQATSGWWRASMLVLVWSAALAGFLAKVIAGHRVNAVTTLGYLALGWLPAIPLIRNTPSICFWWMLAGGICYSLGVIFLKLSHRVRYSHAVWHVLVIAGSACHFWAILLLIARSTQD
ncbi:MAG: hemolysin III family protein [bacterium]|nr:hemolysin III family protein [bacterium]